jgi:hypothetical protein
MGISEKTRIPLFRQNEIFTRIKLYLANLRRKCKHCKGSGYVQQGNQTFKDCEYCNGSYFKYKDFLLCGIPFDYVKLAIGDVESNYAVDCYNKYMVLYKKINDIVGRTLIFYKENEEAWGLTSASIILVKQMLTLGIDSAYIAFSDFLESLIDFGADEEANKRNKEMNEYYLNVDFLAIDDISGSAISKAKGNDGFFVNKLSNLLLTRKRLNKTTIFTFTMTKALIDSSISHSFLDLIIKEGLWFPIACKTKKPNVVERLKLESKELYDIFSNNQMENKKPILIKRKI